MEFIPGSNELFIQQMNRPQNTNKVWIARIGSPTPQNIFTDTDAAWLDTNDNIQWLKDNTWFTWESERNGWRHLYRISRDGKEIQPVTKGDFDYISPVGTDLQKGLVYFIASPENYTQRYLYSAELFGKGEVKRLSPAGQPGQHRYNMSPTGKWAVHTYSNAATPSMIDMVSFPKHQSVRMIEDNAKAREQYAALGLNPKEFVKVTSGNLELDAWMIKPVNFDPTKKYPVIIEVYGEPASSTVQDVWGGGDLWNQYVANLGYIVVSMHLWRGRHVRIRRPGTRHPRYGTPLPVYRRGPYRHYWMERRRKPDTELYVPLSGRLPYGYRHRFRCRPTHLRHDLSGTVHEHTSKQSGRLPKRFSYHIRIRTEREPAPDTRYWRR